MQVILLAIFIFLVNRFELLFGVLVRLLAVIVDSHLLFLCFLYQITLILH